MSTAENKLRARELRTHSDEELRTLEKSLGEELFKFRMQRYTNQLENTMQIRKVRRDRARVQTILSARARGLEARSQGEAVEGAPPAPPEPRAKKAAAKGEAKEGKRQKPAKTAAKKGRKAAAEAQE